MKENLKVEEELWKKAKEQLETQGAKLEGARAELKAAQAELAQHELNSLWLTLRRPREPSWKELVLS